MKRILAATAVALALSAPASAAEPFKLGQIGDFSFKTWDLCSLVLLEEGASCSVVNGRIVITRPGTVKIADGIDWRDLVKLGCKDATGKECFNYIVERQHWWEDLLTDGGVETRTVQ